MEVLRDISRKPFRFYRRYLRRLIHGADKLCPLTHGSSREFNAFAVSTDDQYAWSDENPAAAIRSALAIPFHSKSFSPSLATRASEAFPNPARARFAATCCAIQ